MISVYLGTCQTWIYLPSCLSLLCSILSTHLQTKTSFSSFSRRASPYGFISQSFHIGQNFSMFFLNQWLLYVSAVTSYFVFSLLPNFGFISIYQVLNCNACKQEECGFHLIFIVYPFCFILFESMILFLTHFFPVNVI